MWFFSRKRLAKLWSIKSFNLRAIGFYTSCDWKLGNIRVMFSDFQNCACCKKHIWRIRNTIASIWRKNVLGYLTVDIICSSKFAVFLELFSPKTVLHLYTNNSFYLTRKYAQILCPRSLSVSFEEKIMSKDIWLSIFSPQMKAFVFIIIQIVFATQISLKIEEYQLHIPQV